jgi:hypothetical protein
MLAIKDNPLCFHDDATVPAGSRPQSLDLGEIEFADYVLALIIRQTNRLSLFR